MKGGEDPIDRPGIMLNDLRFTSSNGQELVPVLITSDGVPKKRGHPIDHSLLAKLKRCVLAESWISIEILCDLDVRGSLDQHKPDDSSPDGILKSSERRLNAEIVVSKLHDELREKYQKKLGFMIGYEISNIVRRGEEAARAHLNISNSRDLKNCVRNSQFIASRHQLRDADDLTITRLELQIIRALLIAWAKCQEFINIYKIFSEGRVQKIGRKPKNATVAPDFNVERKYISKIDLPRFEDLILISSHADVNPATLWNNIDFLYEMLEFRRIVMKGNRGQFQTEEEIDFLEDIISKILSKDGIQDNSPDDYFRQMALDYILTSQASPTSEDASYI